MFVRFPCEFTRAHIITIIILFVVEELYIEYRLMLMVFTVIVMHVFIRSVEQ